MKYIWTKLQKEVMDKDKRLNAPFNEVAKKSHEPIEFTKKLQELHDKIDSIYSLLEVLSDRLNTLEYSGTLSRKEEITSPNPYGDDGYATPK
jgi:hypothetical protein